MLIENSFYVITYDESLLEDGSASVGLVLGHGSPSNTTVTISAGDQILITTGNVKDAVSVTLTFTVDNWDQVQTISITAIDVVLIPPSMV